MRTFESVPVATQAAYNRLLVMANLLVINV